MKKVLGDINADNNNTNIANSNNINKENDTNIANNNNINDGVDENKLKILGKPMNL